MLKSEMASLQRLEEKLQRLVTSVPPPRPSRRMELADSIIGKCRHKGDDYEVACCIIDLASMWDLPRRFNEIGKAPSLHHHCTITA